MSINVKTGGPLGPEKDSNIHQQKRDDDVFRGVKIPESVGLVIDFSIFQTNFVDRDCAQIQLGELLQNGSPILIIPFNEPDKPTKQAYIVKQAPEGGS
jgi:hypothetical protein